MAENVKAFFEKLRADDPELQAEYDRQAPRFRALSTLIARRQELEISQSELARRMGVKQPVVAKLESGADNVKIDTLARAAIALGCELEVSFKPLLKRAPAKARASDSGSLRKPARRPR